MAIRHVKEIDMIFNVQNTPGARSIVGTLNIEHPNLRIDDTIGPTFDIHLLYKPRISNWEDFVFISLRCWDAGQNQLKKIIYYRTLGDHQISMPTVIFQRYRVPFREIELYSNQLEKPAVYKGNPNYEIKQGDIITCEILAPWTIEPGRSGVTLQFIQMLGHIGPEEIIVD